jgi:oligosaccharide reducing-end xylanase
LDVNNDKATTYGTNDVQYTFGWNDGTVVGALPSGRSTTGITYSALARTGGYVVEARIPWSTVQATPLLGQKIGIEFMVNDDDDNAARDGKLSWNSATDNAYQDPSLFGTALLADIITDITDFEKSNEVVAFPNPFTTEISVRALGEFEYVLQNVSGEVLESGKGLDQIQLGNNLANGLYFLNIKYASSTKVVKIEKY